MVVLVSPILGLSLRPYTPADQTAVLRLIEADRLPGQPRPTAAMLAEALEGRSSVDAGWWAELEKPAVQVAVDSSETVVGVVSYAVRPKDGTGLLLWLHCREDARTAEALIGHALSELGPREVHAFHFASALSLGLEALPVPRLDVTRAERTFHAGLQLAGRTISSGIVSGGGLDQGRETAIGRDVERLFGWSGRAR